MPYAELCHYEFTSRGREEANEEKLRRWKREQALFIQRWPEFFLTDDPWLGRTYSLRASISRSKAMVFRKSLTFFRYELGRKQGWTTY